MKKTDLQEEVERTLSALDDLQSAQVGEDFEDVLNQKISFLTNAQSNNWMVYSAAAMIVLLLVNMAVFSTVSSQSTVDELSNVEILADDVLYQPLMYQVYDYE